MAEIEKKEERSEIREEAEAVESVEAEANASEESSGTSGEETQRETEEETVKAEQTETAEEAEETASEEHEESAEEVTQEEAEACEQSPEIRPDDVKGRVQAAKARVKSAEEEIEECMEKIQSDLAAFEAYEQKSLLPVVEESQRLLESIGMEEAAIEPALTELELENPEEAKLEIREPSSGKAGAFFWGMIAAAATVAGWYAYAVKQLGTPFIPQKIPDIGSFSALAGKISLLIGPQEHPPVGAALVVGSAVVVWWLVYMILVGIRTAKNRRIAEEVEEQAGFYCQKKEECKTMMEQVREHLKSLHDTVEKYTVLLDEKNAGLRRAIFVEEAERFDQLHERSQAMAREMEELLKELDRLLATPMAKSGVLTPESVEALRHAKRVINDQILRLYS